MHAISYLQVQTNPKGKHYNYKMIVNDEFKGLISFLFHMMYIKPKLLVTDEKNGFLAHFQSLYQLSSILLHDF